jgi:hypothetical protein
MVLLRSVALRCSVVTIEFRTCVHSTPEQSSTVAAHHSSTADSSLFRYITY